MIPARIHTHVIHFIMQLRANIQRGAEVRGGGRMLLAGVFLMTVLTWRAPLFLLLSAAGHSTATVLIDLCKCSPFHFDSALTYCEYDAVSGPKNLAFQESNILRKNILSVLRMKLSFKIKWCECYRNKVCKKSWLKSYKFTKRHFNNYLMILEEKSHEWLQVWTF